MTSEPGPVTPRLVELMGPPGAGKSTVFQSLLAHGPAIARPPLLRKTEPLLFIRIGAGGATLLRGRVSPLRVSVEQLRTMVYIEALPQIVERTLPAEAIVFDQGPFFYLTRPALTDERIAGWRARWFEDWARLLDVVVWLDAPDRDLIERINARDKWHRLKGSHEDDAHETLLRDRALLSDVLADLERRRDGPRILRFDTSRRAPADVAAEVARIVGGSGQGSTALRHRKEDDQEVVPAERQA